MGWLDRFSWWIVLIGVATLGLAPFTPEPHIWEKLRMLAQGALTKPIDMLDLAFHGAPWVLLAAKAARMARQH